MLSINNLSYRYPRQKREALSGINLSIAEGKVSGLLGLNGVGKTTLLNLIGGLLLPKSGKIELLGTDVRLRQARTLSETYLVPDEVSFPPMKAKEYANIMAPFYPRFSKETFDWTMHTFGLETECKLTQLSLGEKKKVAIAMAMASETRLVLMDEPTNGLDIPSKTTFRQVIAKGMTEERTLIVSTHQLHDIEMIIDHVIIMSNEGIKMCRDIASIAKEYTFGEVKGNEAPAEAIYTENGIGGLRAICRRRAEDPETDVDIEMLFCAATNNNVTF